MGRGIVKLSLGLTWSSKLRFLLWSNSIAKNGKSDSANYLLTQRERKSKIPKFLRRVFPVVYPQDDCLLSYSIVYFWKLFCVYCFLKEVHASRGQRSAVTRWNLQISVLKHKSSGKSWVSGNGRRVRYAILRGDGQVSRYRASGFQRSCLQSHRCFGF